MGQDRQVELGETVPLSPAAEIPAPVPAGDDGAPTLAREALDARLQRLGHPRAAVTGGRYEMRGLEGLGATSRVYRVFDRDLAREVAIKVLARSGPEDADEVASFIDEARITAELQHPNVLPVYELDAGERGEVFFSMKRIEGRSLGDVLVAAADGQPDPRFTGAEAANAIVSVFIDVCQALSYAHHRGIVHQDVKPDNIMLGGFGEVLLVDWGSAARVDEAQARIYGTPLYMSPEQARRERATPSSDVFCVGASLFHAIIGRPPTSADSFEELLRRRGAGEIDAPTAVERALAPPALLHVALKAIAPSPGDRYASADALLADLRAYQAGLAVSAYPEPPWRRAWRWYLLHRRAFWAMAAVAALVAGLGVELVLERAKQRASWSRIADDDFGAMSATDVGVHWVVRAKLSDEYNAPFHEEDVVLGRHWRITDGRMRSVPGDDYSELVWRGGLGGDLRVEWDARPDRTNLDINCFIGADRESGYTFHIGTHGDPRRTSLTRGPRYDPCDGRLLDEPLRAGRTYAFVLERLGQRLRLTIDGQTLYDYVDDDPLASMHGDAFGFDCYRDHGWSIGHVRVYDRPLPELVSPLEVAQALYRHGDAAAAVTQYAEIERVHAGTPLALTAQVARGIALIRGVDRSTGHDLLDGFVKANPDHQLAALCTVELEGYARSQHLDTDVVELRQRLVRWRGQPILRRVLQEIDADSRVLFQPQPVTEPGGNRYSEDQPARVVAAVAELRRWAEAYGQSVAGFEVMTVAAEFLRRAGRFDDAFATSAPGSVERSQLLLAVGDYQQLVDNFPYSPDVRGRALFELGRKEDIVADDTLLDEMRARALVDLGRPDEAAAHFPRTDAGSEVLLREGRYDEFDRAYAGHERDHESYMAVRTPRFRSLRARHEWDRILAEYTDDSVHWDALIGLGRIDEALALRPADGWALLQVAFTHINRGEREAGFALLRALRDRRPASDEDADGFATLMRDVWPVFTDGARTTPETAMAAILRGDRRWYGGSLWHNAALIAGAEDEPAFRAQPRRRSIDHDLHLCRAVRADLLGQRDSALAEYEIANRLPSYLSDSGHIHWRLGELKLKLKP
jgi:hypothetical protein